ncbi:MAG: hypothetical protein DRH32_09965 [Deltaproteobacteria bacterium]|nr:MAG: hypothetical protein DRH32_09965 [Deltaproteobacteria bacterium]
MYEITANRNKFDFEIGYCVKSPCRDCARYSTSFPGCVDDCETIDKIQTVLAECISCFNHHADT